MALRLGKGAASWEAPREALDLLWSYEAGASSKRVPPKRSPVVHFLPGGFLNLL